MTFKTFVNKYGINLDFCELRSSETKCYKDSTIPITYIELNKTIDGYQISSQTRNKIL